MPNIKVNCRLDCNFGWIKPGNLPGTRKSMNCPEKRCPYNHYGLVGMKVLSLIMPWPWLILHHGKDVENRSWRTDYRGRILLHASKKPDNAVAARLVSIGLVPSIGVFTGIWQQCGYILGSVEVVDCVRQSKSKWAEPEQWHWVLKDPVPLALPIPARGSLGLWEYKGDTK